MTVEIRQRNRKRQRLTVHPDRTKMFAFIKEKVSLLWTFLVVETYNYFFSTHVLSYTLI